MTRPMRGWCGCTRRGGRRRRPRRDWLRLRRSGRRIGVRDSIQRERSVRDFASLYTITGEPEVPSKRIAIAGLGEIGRTLARKLAQGMPGLTLAGVVARDQAKAQGWLDREGIACPLVSLDD